MRERWTRVPDLRADKGHARENFVAIPMNYEFVLESGKGGTSCRDGKPYEKREA